MPRIPQITASGQSGTLNLGTVSPNSFGAQAGQGLSAFGQSLFALDAKQRDQQNRLDLAKLATDYDAQLALHSGEVLAEEPDIRKHQTEFTRRMTETQTGMLKGVESHAVQTAFKIHAEQATARAQFELATDGRKLTAQRQIGQYVDQADSLMVEAAGAGPGKASEELISREEYLRNGLVESGAITPEKGLELGKAAQDRHWSIVAQQTPERVIGIMRSGETPYGMDPARQHVYTELAFQSMAAQQKGHDADQKAQDAQVKLYQDANSRLLLADLREGKSVAERIPGLLKSRGLTTEDANMLTGVEEKLRSAPDPAQYLPTRSAEIETVLGQLKFSAAPLPPEIEQHILSDFVSGRILKPEFEHLMTVWGGVQAHRMQGGKEAQNAEVGHARAALVEDLETTGPADKFDAFSRQNIVSAKEYFDRRMVQTPDANPRQVAEEAKKIFKPVIEQRLNISKEDKAKLDDAKMRGMKESKAITPAAYKAWNEREQNRRGMEAVQEAIKNLPPPKEPSFWERINPFKSQSPEPPKRKPGVMGK